MWLLGYCVSAARPHLLERLLLIVERSCQKFVQGHAAWWQGPVIKAPQQLLRLSISL